MLKRSALHALQNIKAVVEPPHRQQQKHSTNHAVAEQVFFGGLFLFDFAEHVPDVPQEIDKAEGNENAATVKQDVIGIGVNEL
ncbi:hypothetical protein VCR4J5_670052 [Vibrio crassostreae]|uniref:Uncharacterized protein n=1 Tax=Vibrio crassostreae TaxID=246167 RepID=A0ABP1X3Y9_9VIBR|nr:hypothetical protein VCR4J5_670052 [Vibrio crassostreae]